MEVDLPFPPHRTVRRPDETAGNSRLPFDSELLALCPMSLKFLPTASPWGGAGFEPLTSASGRRSERAELTVSVPRTPPLGLCRAGKLVFTQFQPNSQDQDLEENLFLERKALFSSCPCGDPSQLSEAWAGHASVRTREAD